MKADLGKGEDSFLPLSGFNFQTASPPGVRQPALKRKKLEIKGFK
jgi:hypothetical protein